MPHLIPYMLLVCGVAVGITMAIWFNCSIHQEMRRRIGISQRVMPIVEAKEVDEVPVNTEAIILNV